MHCTWCGSENVGHVCGGCDGATYCSKDCQTQDWQNFHKYACARQAPSLQQIGACVDPRSARANAGRTQYVDGRAPKQAVDPRSTLGLAESVPVWVEAFQAYFNDDGMSVSSDDGTRLLNAYGNASIDHFAKDVDRVRARLVNGSAEFAMENESQQRARALLDLYFDKVADGDFASIIAWNQSFMQTLLDRNDPAIAAVADKIVLNAQAHRGFLYVFGMSYDKYGEVLYDYVVKEMDQFVKEQTAALTVPKEGLAAAKGLLLDLKSGVKVPGNQFCKLLEYVSDYNTVLRRAEQAEKRAFARKQSVSRLQIKEKQLFKRIKELVNVEEKLNASASILRQANATIKSLGARRDELDAQLREATTSLEREQGQSTRTAKQLQEKEKRLRGDTARIEILKKTMNLLEERLDRQTKRLSEKDLEAANKCDLSELSEVRKKLSRTSMELDDARSELKDVQTTKTVLRARHTALSGEFEKLQTNATDGAVQLRAAIKEIKRLKDAQKKMVPAKELIDFWTQEVDSKNARIRALKRREREFDRRASALADANEHISILEQEVIALEARDKCPSSNGPQKRSRMLLALDGGGVKGLVMARILRAIFMGEEELFDSEDHDFSNFTNHFDMVGGTSTGAIMAYAAALKKMSLKKVDSLYWDNIDNIQQSSWSERIEAYLKEPASLIEKFIGVESDTRFWSLRNVFGSLTAKAGETLINWLWNTRGPQRMVLSRDDLQDGGPIKLVSERDDYASVLAPTLSFEKFKTRTIEETYKDIFSTTSVNVKGKHITRRDRLDEAPFAYNEKYDHISIERRLNDPEYRPRTFSVSLNVDSVTPTFCVFRNYETTEDCSGKRYNLKATDQAYLWEGVRASSAAPTYFAPFARVPEDRTEFPNASEFFNKGVFVDGGVGNNNPALVALTESTCVFDTAEIRGIISLGCGQGPSPFNTAYASFSGNPFLISEGRRVDSSGNATPISERQRLFAGLKSVQELVQGLMLGQLVFGKEHSELAANLLESYGISHLRLDPMFSNGVPDLAETNELVLLNMLEDLDEWIEAKDGLKLVLASRRLLFGDKVKDETKESFLDKMRAPRPHEKHLTDTKLRERSADLDQFRRTANLEKIITGRANVIKVSQVIVTHDGRDERAKYRVHWIGVSEEYDAFYFKHETTIERDFSLVGGIPDIEITTTYSVQIPRVSEDDKKTVQRDSLKQIEYDTREVEKDPTSPGEIFDLTTVNYGAHIPDRVIVTAQASQVE